MQPQVSVIIPTYNRRVILKKALEHLGRQTLPPEAYEVILIDDGSTDGTGEMVQTLQLPYRLEYRRIDRSGPATARNVGIRLAQAELIVFIDSDIVVNDEFLQAHLEAHTEDNLIGHGPVIHTDNLDDPTSAQFKVTDISRAFFATGNASIRKKHLLAAGLFDESFVEYGWEDLELGIRLRRLGLRAVKVPQAKGYHYKKRLAAADVPAWRQRERERGHTAVTFYQKVPTRQVRLMTMLFPLTFWLDTLFSLGGWPDRPGTKRFLEWLDKRGYHLALRFFVRLITHHSYVTGLREGLAAQKRQQSPEPS